MESINPKLWIRLFVIVIALAAVSCLPDTTDDLEVEGTEVLMSRHDNRAGEITDIAAQNRLLAAVHRATAKYQRVEEALADGYAPASPCVYAPGVGAMGVHYVNFSLVDGEHDPLRPEALLYEPKNGRMNLVGVEYIMVAALMEDGSKAPLFGQLKMDDHLHGAPLGFPHYQLHVWLWKNNPAGMYTPYNPKVSCE